LTHLQKLDIEENEINNLPTYLFDLPNLYQLHAGKNTFTIIPAEIAKLKKLRSLTIFSDHLTTISE
jgi:Leucine-rich repeat (LRR) protein